MTPVVIPPGTARRLFLAAQGLLGTPPKADPSTVLAMVQKVGFLQLDAIQVAGRAHDLTLRTRLEGYEPNHLEVLLEEDRTLFEGWTHDASAIPTQWHAHWKPRYRRDGPRIEASAWWRNLLGDDHERVCKHVLARIRKEGPLGSADFEHPEKRGPWWGWKPQKAALDYLWRTGRLAVCHRIHFHKRYDLPERVFPQLWKTPEPAAKAQVEWACATAAARLEVFTPKELAAFWEAVDPAEARSWCQEALKEGRIEQARIESHSAPPQQGYVLAGWERRLAHLPEASPDLRFLNPFDPVLRDRDRALRRFDLAYRFEAFTPEAKRAYGYYVMPILAGERFIGRLDPKFHRDRGVLEVRGLWWEAGQRVSAARRRKLDAALEAFAAFLGGTYQGMPKNR